MSRFAIQDTPLAGLKVITRQPLGDSRGFLERMFCAEALAACGWHKPLAQINHTFTAQRGTVRGLHYQMPPHAEMKLVACLTGEIWDVAVDLRAGSPTFMHWHAEKLSAENGKSLLIPEGFAHGLQTLSDNVHLLYCHSCAYAPAYEGGAHVNDPRLAIGWPLAITAISARDEAHPELPNDYQGIPAQLNQTGSD